jgi:hypothetical protein
MLAALTGLLYLARAGVGDPGTGVATNSLSAIVWSEQRSVFQDLLEAAGSLRAETGPISARAGGKKWRKIEGYGRYWSMGALPPLPPHGVHRPSERPLPGVARLAANLAG